MKHNNLLFYSFLVFLSVLLCIYSITYTIGIFTMYGSLYFEGKEDKNKSRKLLKWTLNISPWKVDYWKYALRIDNTSTFTDGALRFNREDPEVLNLVYQNNYDFYLIQKAQQLDPRNSDNFRNILGACIKHKDTKNAWTVIEEITQRRTNDSIFENKTINLKSFNIQNSYFNEEVIKQELDRFNLYKDLSRNDEIAKFYYRLALQEYLSGNKLSTDILISRSILLTPDWSFFHLERVALLWELNQKEEAYKQLQLCQKFDSPRQYCHDYEIQNWNKKEIDTFGFLKESIEKDI